MENRLLTEPDPAEEYSSISSIDAEKCKLIEPVSDPQKVADLLALANAKTQRRKRQTLVGLSAIVPAFLMLFVLSAVGSAFFGSTDKFAYVGAAIFAALIPFMLHHLRKANRSVGFDTSELARIGGVRAIPALLDSLLVDGTLQARAPVNKAIVSLLPQMKASDAALLTSKHRAHLNQMLSVDFVLGFKTDLDCMLAILKAYEQIGDAKAIPTVEAMVKRKPRNERQRKLKQAAIECLPMLRDSARVLETSNTLLRPVSSRAPTTETLLRPAAGALHSDSDQLLRSSELQR